MGQVVLREGDLSFFLPRGLFMRFRALKGGMEGVGIYEINHRLRDFIALWFDSFAPQIWLEQQVKLPLSQPTTQTYTSLIY